jgi:hypothetical protein
MLFFDVSIRKLSKDSYYFRKCKNTNEILFSRHKMSSQYTKTGCTVREQVNAALVPVTSSICPVSFFESEQEYRI